MSFLPTELVRKKRFGASHTREELRFLVREFSSERLPDYQMAAWLMAVCFQGMSDEERGWFAIEMRDSGEVLDLKALGRTVDKHSTGGIGDKTSLLIAPIVAAAGVPVPMMAGRGLAHTGGTLDKLESIPGFNVNLSLSEFKNQVKAVGAAIIGQTRDICPADRKLYALRDVTGTVDSLPLICGSIMSKKLASGVSALVLDVKCGSGAFMKTPEEAEALARALKDIGERAGQKVVAVITAMDEPLGRFVGNALEINECLEILKGRSPDDRFKSYADTKELSIVLAGHMMVLGGKAENFAQGKALAERLLESGAALAKFEEICEHQGGDIATPLEISKFIHSVTAQQSGIFYFVNIEKVGLANIHLRAGRKLQTDKLDHSTGIEVLRRSGDRVKSGDELFRVYHSKGSGDLAAALNELNSSFVIGSAERPINPLLLKVI